MIGKCKYFILFYPQPRQNVLQAASRVGEASYDVMDGVGETTDDMDKAYQVPELLPFH